MYNYKISLAITMSVMFSGCTQQQNVIDNPKPSTVVDNGASATKNIYTNKRLALVIGNGAYSSMPNELQPLPNPPNDAEDVANALLKLGFDVILLKDATLEAMDEGIHAFNAKINKGDVALLYYSGHGIQVSGENYLLPVDALFKREDQVERQAIKASVLLEQLDKARTKLIFLDACRNNPFLANNVRASRGMGKVRGGLAKTLAPDGTLLAYSTDPDNVAEDGENSRNSPFTQSLLRHINTPGIDAQIMLRRVRTEVRRNTENRQTPWDSSSLEGEFYFVPDVENNETPPNNTTPVIATVTLPTPVTQPVIATAQNITPITRPVTPIFQTPAINTSVSKETELEKIKHQQQELARALLKAREEEKRIAAEAEAKRQAEAAAHLAQMQQIQSVTPPQTETVLVQPPANIEPTPTVQTQQQLEMAKTIQAEQARLESLKQSLATMQYKTSPTPLPTKEPVVAQLSPPEVKPVNELIAKRYRNHGDGTLTDLTTNLMWKRCSEGQEWINNTCVGDPRRITWHEAMLNSQQKSWVSFASHNDWRLPTIDELRTLVYCSNNQPKMWNNAPYHHGCTGEFQHPVINLDAFPGTLASWFWSSSSDSTSNSNDVLTLYFEDGDDYSGTPLNPTEVRLVRNTR